MATSLHSAGARVGEAHQMSSSGPPLWQLTPPHIASKPALSLLRRARRGNMGVLRPYSLALCALTILLFWACLLDEVEAKNKVGKLVKNAAKGYTAHKAARAGMSIFRIIFMVIAGVVAIIAVAACVMFVRRRLRSSESEGFGLLHNGP